MPTQVPELEIHDESARIVKGWGTVDIFDNANERLPIEEFKKLMPIIMKRGGLVMNSHTNQTAGKILNYEFKMKDTPEGPKEGVYLTTQAFDDFDSDDETWEAIKAKDGDKKIEGFSFGGRHRKNPELDFSKGITRKTLKGLEAFEFSYVPKGCNKEATIEEINYIAKGDNESETEIRLNKIEEKLGIEKKEYNDENKKDSDTDDETLSKNDSTLDSEAKVERNLIKNEDSNINMAEDTSKGVQKVEDAPQAADPAPQNSMEDRMGALEANVEAIKNAVMNTQKVKEEEDEDKDKDKVEKEGDGEKVKLPESVGDETSQDKPAEGAKGDEAGANFLAKEEEMESRITKNIMKGLNDKRADTPRPAMMANNINKSEGMPVAQNWAQANKQVKDLGRY